MLKIIKPLLQYTTRFIQNVRQISTRSCFFQSKRNKKHTLWNNLFGNERIIVCEVFLIYAMTRHIILIHERVIVVWGLFYLCHDKTHYFDSELTRVTLCLADNTIFIVFGLTRSYKHLNMYTLENINYSLKGKVST
jgi:hypothetical protein